MRLLKYALVMGAFLTGILLQAQQYSMSLQGEVTLQAQDMDAATYYPMSDENDNLCSLIKVTVTQDLANPLVLETGGLAVVKREVRPDGEIWFWVPSQVRNLRFSCKGYKAMDPIPVRLQVAKVYRLTLRTDAVVSTFTTVQQTFTFLKIQVVPEAASNALISIGKTPSYELDARYAEDGFYASSQPLDFGTYYYKVQHEQFETYTGTLKLDENFSIQEVVLKPLYGTFVLNTTPGGCQVSVDGKPVGTSPLEQQLSVGSHRVQVSKSGYQTQSFDIQIRHNERWNEQRTLSKQVAQKPAPQPQPSQQGTVSGRVTDADTDEELIGASVLVKGEGGKVVASAVTDKDGYFSLQAPGDATLEVMYLGYTTARVPINHRSEVSLKLQKDVVRTESVSKDPEVTGKFSRITVEHNVEQDGVKGMHLLLDFSISGMKDKEGRCTIYFYDQDGVKLKDQNGSYRASDGQICVGRDITPGYETSYYTDYKVFMPYRELELSPGTHVLKYHCQVWDRSVQPNISRLRSETYEFKVEKGANGAADKGSTVAPITGKFKDITVEHNFVKDGVKGMKILVDFEVQHMRGTDGSCDVYVYLENGDLVKGKNSDYQSSRGTLTTSAAIYPRYEDASYTDYELFLPYSEFDLGKGKFELKFYCRIWEKSSGWKKVIDSDYQYFTFTRE